MPTPYVGREFTFTNPDGTLVRVRGYGNQFAAVFETLDGFTVAKDPQPGSIATRTCPRTGPDWSPPGPGSAPSSRQHSTCPSTRARRLSWPGRVPVPRSARPG